MKPKSSLLSFLALCGSTLLGVNSVNATQFWDGTGSDANWNTPENWGGDTLPAFTTTTINFGGTNAGGTAVGNVAALQTTANNDLAADSLIYNIALTNNGTSGRTQAFTLEGNSITLGNLTNTGITTTAVTTGPAIEDVVSLNINLNSPASAQNKQFQQGTNHNLKIDGVISGGANAILLARSANNSKLTLTNANNSYVGITNIGGTNTGVNLLEITSIANGGLNSSIGASSSAATNLRFGALNQLGTDTLRYIGATNASTDRLFQLSGNAVMSSAIESSGAGTLSFTNTGAIASSHQKARNFYLGGTNTGDNTFAPTLSNFTEVSTFTKQGTGKWILTGDHTYTGATNVNAGTLEIASAGSINSVSAITIESGAQFKYNSSTALTNSITINGGTISGTGNIGVAVSLDSTNDIISPGNSPGIQPYGTGQTWSSFTYEWETKNFIGNTAGTDFDQITIDGNLTLTGASSGSYVLDLISLTALDAAGNVGGFSDVNRSWSILTTTGTIGGFNASYWDIDAITGPNVFTSSPGLTGTWSLGINGSNNALILSYTTAIPEPGAALLGSLGLLALLRRRR
jgi:autotransporter-associated beta strand protein